MSAPRFDWRCFQCGNVRTDMPEPAPWCFDCGSLMGRDVTPSSEARKFSDHELFQILGDHPSPAMRRVFEAARAQTLREAEEKPPETEKATWLYRIDRQDEIIERLTAENKDLKRKLLESEEARATMTYRESMVTGWLGEVRSMIDGFPL